MKTLESILKRSTKNLNFHFVGIGGVSMQSLAIFINNLGYKVTGSDISNESIKMFKKLGIKVYHGHHKENISTADVVVYSLAAKNCEEVIFALKDKKLVVTRAELLGAILKQYRNSICVSGAHGKTTTTALIFSILELAYSQGSVSLHLGGNLCQTGKSYLWSENKDTIVCEACEYQDSFLNFLPSVGVILNVAPEHLDYFKTYENVKNSFIQFSKQSKVLVINNACDIYEKVKLSQKDKKIITFGRENTDFIAKNIKKTSKGINFDCYKDNSLFLNVDLNLSGEHNVYNALAAIAVCDYLHVSKDIIFEGLKTFAGVERRFERLNKNKFIVADYAHHPDEIKAAIKEAREVYKDQLLVVFQPHTYSRTKTLMSEFIKTFSDVENLVVLKTYSARESYDRAGSSKTLAENLGKSCKYYSTFKEAKSYVLDKIDKGYGVLFLGAGDIYNLAKKIGKLC